MSVNGATINLLPPEILTKVFQCAINTTYDPWNMHYSVELTLTLCSVCPYWRGLIIGNASLWSCIPMGDDTYAENLTRLFLERSQRNNLIDIVAFARYSGDNGEAWQALEELKQNAHRLRSLSIVATSLSGLNHLLRIALTDQVPPSLIRLTILVKPNSSYLPIVLLPSAPWAENFVRLCDQLQVLEMNNVWSDFGSYSFSRMERLTLDASTGLFINTRYLLPAAHRLHFLEIRDIATWRVRERTDLEPAHGVRTLRLRHPYPFCRWELQGDLESKEWDIIDFHLPHNLTAGPKAHAERKIEFLISYMRTNSSKITSLTLRNDRPEVIERIDSMLQVLPYLHTLTFDKLELTESILSLFIPSSGRPGAFPRFHTLRLLLSDVTHPKTFQALISSHPIQRLDLWRSTLEWGDGTVGSSYRPVGPSPFYEWLSKQVPELYISQPC